MMMEMWVKLGFMEKTLHQYIHKNHWKTNWDIPQDMFMNHTGFSALVVQGTRILPQWVTKHSPVGLGREPWKGYPSSHSWFCWMGWWFPHVVISCVHRCWPIPLHWLTHHWSKRIRKKIWKIGHWSSGSSAVCSGKNMFKTTFMGHV